MTKRIECRKKEKFKVGEKVVLTGYRAFRGEILKVEEVRGQWLIVENDNHRIRVLKNKCLTMAEAMEQATWVMMGGFPACEKHGCSPADWEDGFPPYCRSCGARRMGGNDENNHSKIA